MLLPEIAAAQGKIAGRVTDAGNGDGLPGVNVALEGLQQGAITDVDGNYIILNVRPDTYTLVFTYVGFGTQRIAGVRASTGQTTRINVKLQEEVIQGQEIVVQAERPLIQKDLTASSKTVVSEEIAILPVESFFGVLATQAGVNQGAGGEIHIRGGRSNEISYLVDGLSVGNPFNTNGLATGVSTEAIQEMTVISGAFNAEFGRAMSGIVNLVTKEGSPDLHGSVSIYGGDNVSGSSTRDLFLKPSGFGVNVRTLEATLSGALPIFRNIRFFVSGRQDKDDGHIYGQRLHLPSDSANFNVTPWYYEIQGVPSDQVDPESLSPETVAMNPSTSHNFLAKLTTRPMRGGKLEYSFLRDGTVRTPFSFAYRFNPDGVAEIKDRSYNHSIHWTHTLSDRMFYTARFSYADNDFKSFLYEDPTDPRYVSTGAILGFPGLNFNFGGNQKGHVYENAKSLRTKIDATRQAGLIHEMKAGLELQVHNLDRENFVVLFDGNRYQEPTVPDLDSPAHDKYENQKVTEFSAYLQDKLEFDDFIINAGFRYERFDPNGRYIPDLLDPQAETAESTVKNIYMPRLGVSFPITDRGIIHFSYGHFAQMPTLRNMYINPEFEFPVGNAPTFGNSNLRPERTIQYEIGLQQQVGDLLAFDVTAYFKDIRDYLALQQIRHSTIAGEDRYLIYLNRDYANVKGVTFALTKRRSQGGLLSANVDYTFQIAEGNNTDSDAFFFNFLSGRENELEVVPLGFDQRHIISTTVSIARPGNWGVSFIGNFSTGYPYTPLILDQNIDQLPNQGRKPIQSGLNARLFKDLNLKGLDVRFFAKVFNVFNILNERFVFDDTGSADYSLSEQRNLHATWQSYYGFPGIKTLDQYESRPQYYSAPREVRLGVTLAF